MTTTITGPAAAAPAVDPPRSKREIYTVMSGLLLAMLLAMLDNLVVGTAMPTIVGELGGLAHLSWVVTAYTLATAVATPVWAKLGDLYGRKGIFMASIVLFLAGSALSGLSQNMGELIGFRGLQGLGAGGLMVGAIAIIADLVPLRERGRYQGLMAAVMPLAFIGGPLLGGFLTDNFSWRWAFYINLPLGVLALVVVALTMHLPVRHRDRVRIDWSGAALLASGIAALTLLTSWGGSQYPWTSAPIISLGAVTVAALAAFVAVERRVAEPILALTLFGSRNFTAATILTLFTGFALFGAMTFLPQFQQNVQGASATSSGLLLLPLMAGMLATSLLGGQVVTRTGRYRSLLIAGAVILTAGLGLLATMGVTTGQFTTSMYMVVLGAGMGLLMQTTQLVAQNSVAQRDVGAASGAVTLFRTLGGSLGVSLLGTLFTQQVTSSLTATGAQAGQVGTGHVTPGMLAQLPAPLRDAYQNAITSGIQQVFFWGAVIAVFALISAWAIREVPMRGIEAPAAPDGAVIPRPAEPVISGAVHHGDGSPLAGTPVTLIDTAGREIAVVRTAVDGSYRLAAPTPGAYLLVASASGHRPVASPLTVVDGPVRHDIMLPDLDPADCRPAHQAPTAAATGQAGGRTGAPSRRKSHLAVVATATAGLILMVTFTLWPASTNAGAAPVVSSAGQQPVTSPDPAMLRQEGTPTSANPALPAAPGSTPPSPIVHPPAHGHTHITSTHVSARPAATPTPAPTNKPTDLPTATSGRSTSALAPERDHDKSQGHRRWTSGDHRDSSPSSGIGIR